MMLSLRGQEAGVDGELGGDQEDALGDLIAGSSAARIAATSWHA
jgi:hypothetical protein